MIRVAGQEFAVAVELHEDILLFSVVVLARSFDDFHR